MRFEAPHPARERAKLRGAVYGNFEHQERARVPDVAALGERARGAARRGNGNLSRQLPQARFRTVHVSEPSIEETRHILYSLRPRLERNYSVRIKDEAIETALRAGRGRLDVLNGPQAHLLADKSKAVSDCHLCHQQGAQAFQKVTISLVGPDGRRVGYGASSDVLNSPFSIDAVRGFYAIGGTRIWILDVLLVLAIVGGVGVAVGHLFLGWFFGGSPNVPIVARGVIGGLIVATSLAPFGPTWAVLLTGAIGGAVIAVAAIDMSGRAYLVLNAPIKASHDTVAPANEEVTCSKFGAG